MSSTSLVMTMERGRTLGGYLVLTLGVLLLLASAFRGLTRDLGSTTAEPAPGYRTVSATRGDLAETVVATGRMEPVARVPVRSEVSGVIRHVQAEEGQRVTRGEPLFELDRERLQDRVNELRANLQMRRASARYDLVGRATLELQQARRAHNRIAALHARGVASVRDHDDSLHALQLAEVALRDARAEQAARTAAVAQAEHTLHRAEKDLERAVIRAPIDGLVVERPAELGAVVADVTSSGATLLAVVADDERIRLVAEVDENDIAPVRVGQSARVALDAFPGETFTGIVRKVSSSGTVERNASSFEVEIELPGDPRIRVGMSADARVVVHEHRDAVLIPNAAIGRGAEGPWVRVADAQVALGYRRVPIREGYSDGFHTVVAEGLMPGDAVLVPQEAAE